MHCISSEMLAILSSSKNTRSDIVHKWRLGSTFFSNLGNRHTTLVIIDKAVSMARMFTFYESTFMKQPIRHVGKCVKAFTIFSENTFFVN